MANNCWNWVEFSGENCPQITARIEKFNAEEYTVDAYRALLPDGVELSDDQIMNDNPKWLSIEHYDDFDDSLTFYGDSAWNPPSGLVQLICKYWNVSARVEFEECGNDFGGFEKYNEQGCLVESLTVPYKHWRYLQEGLDGLESEFECVVSDKDDAINFLADIKPFVTENEYKYFEEKL
jgi:hypothetical protein